MGVKYILKHHKLTKKQYEYLRERKEYYTKFHYHGKFLDRSKGCDTVCIILAGYKEFLYPSVFERIEQNLNDHIDVCVISSGLYSDILDKLCEKNQWSYLSTKENNVCLVQNVAIKLHPKAKYIFKLDEDIFLTNHFFENMMRAYKHAQEAEYNPGVLAPLIPLNGYGHYRILDKLNLKDYYSRHFENPELMAGPDRKIEHDTEVAKFFWGNTDVIPSIDDMNQMFQSNEVEERPCPIRFSIGAILFERLFWQKMGGGIR
jgi:hypothetical protein